MIAARVFKNNYITLTKLIFLYSANAVGKIFSWPGFENTVCFTVHFFDFIASQKEYIPSVITVNTVHTKHLPKYSSPVPVNCSETVDRGVLCIPSFNVTVSPIHSKR